MSVSPWPALALFAFVASITPGPNNLLATASAARFGFRRTLPQVAGVTFGFTILLLLAASGIAAIVVAHPGAGLLVAVAGLAYLAWLSMRLLSAAWRPQRTAASTAVLQPMGFCRAAAFQFANPKACMMAVSAASSAMTGSDRTWVTVTSLCALFAAINFPCVGAWAALGARLSTWLGDDAAPWRMRAFDGSMGVTLLATTAWMACRTALA